MKTSASTILASAGMIARGIVGSIAGTNTEAEPRQDPAPISRKAARRADVLGAKARRSRAKAACGNPAAVPSWRWYF